MWTRACTTNFTSVAQTEQPWRKKTVTPWLRVWWSGPWNVVRWTTHTGSLLYVEEMDWSTMLSSILTLATRLRWNLSWRNISTTRNCFSTRRTDPRFPTVDFVQLTLQLHSCLGTDLLLLSCVVILCTSPLLSWVTTGGTRREDTSSSFQRAVNTQGSRLLKLLGDTESTEVGNVGWEQEFFCLDREDFLARPDLMACGRTLIGAQPARGQQTDYNYFNKINPRVKSFLEDCQRDVAGRNCLVCV